MAAQATNSTALCGMRWAGWALVVMFAPAAAGASTAERVFAAVSPSVVVVQAANNQSSGVVVAPQVVARASSWSGCRTAPTVACLLAEARDIAGGLGPSVLASVAHTAIARAQARAGDITGALATARSIQHTDPRVWALAGIAHAQAQAGDRQGAAQTLA
jgi:hypothetical protein